MGKASLFSGLEQPVGYRTSPQQRSLLRQVDDCPFLTQGLIELVGDVHEAACAKTIEALCQRHEILRTDFCRGASESEHIQVICDDARIAWTTTGPYDHLQDDTEKAALALMERERSQSFALDHGPQMRLAMLRTGHDRIGLVWTVPAVRCDARSMQLLARQFAQTYGRAAENQDGSENGAQYADLSEALNQLLESNEAARGRQLWSELGFSRGASRASGVGKSGRAVAPFRAVAGSFWLPQALAAPLRAHSDKLQIPLAGFLEAAWFATNWRLRDASPMSVGMRCDCRNHIEIEHSIGPFAKHLPLPFPAEEPVTFADWATSLHLRRMHGEALSEYCDPNEAIDSRDLVSSPGFDCTFAHHDIVEKYAGVGPTVRLLRVGSYLDRQTFGLTCLQRPEGHLFVLEYDGTGNARHDAEGVVSCFLTYLAAAIRSPSTRLVELPLVELPRVLPRLVEVQSSGLVATTLTLHGLFEDQVTKTPQAIAISFGEIELTYSELNERASRLAAVLAARSIGHESRVAIWLDRSPQLVVAILAVLKCGAAFVPFDPGHPPRYLAEIVADCGAAAVIGVPADVRAYCPHHLAIIDPDDATITGLSAEGRAPEIWSENLAYIIYTSGSSGRPKGVMVSHKAVVNYLSWCRGSYLKGDGGKVLLHSSTGFDFSITPLFLPLITGRSLVLLPEGNAVMAVVDLLTQLPQIGMLKLTPSHVRLIERLLRSRPWPSNVDTLVVGGEALTAEMLEKWRDLAPATQIVNEYGPTEATVGCVAHFVSTADPQTGPVAIGQPIEGMRIWILDQGMNPVPAGVAGELYVGGVGLARGYLGMPAHTADRFVPDPFSNDGERLYRTSDRVRRDAAGSLIFEGRLDNQFKIRGVRAEPSEIEAVLTTHEAVDTAVVVDSETESAEKAIIAYLVAKDSFIAAGGHVPGAEELTDFLRQRLPAALVPAFCIWLAELPLTRNHKIDHRLLPVPPKLDSVVHGEAPRSEAEEILASIWQRILRRSQLSVADNYFTMGGDSIRAIEIVAQARQRGISLSVADIFLHPTVRGLAEAVSLSPSAPLRSDPCDPFDLISDADRRQLPADAEDAYPLTRLQAGMIFHQSLDPGTAVYHDIFSYRIAMPVDLDAMQVCAADLVTRHPALRTSFDVHRYSQPLQIVHRDGHPILHVENLSHLSAAEQDAVVDRWIKDEKSRGFDIARTPLVRIHVHMRNQNSAQFSLSFHHAILDGWSDAVILSELFEHYFAVLESSDRRPTAPVLHFREFVMAEQASLRNEKSRQYWQAMLSDCPSLKLPRRLDRSGGQSPQVKDLVVEIAESISDAVHAAAHSLAVPIKCVLLAAHLRVLSLLSNRTDVLTCVVSSGRPERMGGERAVGLFINTLPFRMQLGGGTWRQLIDAVFASEREALPHRTFPLPAMHDGSKASLLSDALFYFTHYHIFEALDRHPKIEVIDTISHEVTSFALVANFSVDPRTRRLQLRLACDSGALPDQDAAVVADLYRNALAAISSDLESRYETVDLLSPEARSRSLQLGRGECGPSNASGGHVASRIAATAKRQPEAIAVRCGGRQLTYGELDRLSGKLAHHLRAQGLGNGDSVGICLPRGVAMVVAYLGILKAGAYVLPLEPSHPAKRHLTMLEETSARAVIFEPGQSFDLASCCETAIPLDETCDAISRFDELVDLAMPHDEAIAYVCFTSGSTGRPRGVEVPHRALTNLLAWMTEELAISPADVLVSVTSIAFDIAALELLLPLATGATLVVAHTYPEIDPRHLLETLKEHRATIMQATPGVWQLLVDTGWSPPRAMRVLCGGEAMTPDLRRALVRDGAQAWNLYGPTETTIWSSAQRLSEGDTELSLGDAAYGTQLYVLDPHLQLVPDGIAGEIFISGVGLARCYLRQPFATAERFLPDPHSPEPGARMYRSGDIARRAFDGRLEFLGRRDTQIKLRGHRIELSEIEVALKADPEVSNAVVLLHERVPGNRTIVAYVTASSGCVLEGVTLSRRLRLVLPGHLIPAAFVVLDHFPITSNGKIDRAALPAPDTARHSPGRPLACAADSALTQVLSMILRDLLRQSDLSTADDLLSLGLDSLGAVRFKALLQEFLGVNVPLRELFGNVTIAEVEAFLRRAATSPEELEQRSELLIRVSTLSEDQVARQLAPENRQSHV